MQVLDKGGRVYTKEKDVGHDGGGQADLHLLLGDLQTRGDRLGVLPEGFQSNPGNQGMDY